MRHSLAELQLDLPMATDPQPLRPAGRYPVLPTFEGGIDLERAKDLCALLSDLGYDVPLETVRGYTAEQADRPRTTAAGSSCG